MPINPAIALGVKGIELQDPLAQYGKVMTIQNAQQQNQLAQLQMQAAQREQAATNALNKAYGEAYNPQTGEVDVNRLRSSLATGGFGSKLPAVEKGLLELQTARTAQQKGQTELVDSKLKQSRSFLENIDPNAPGAAEAYIAWHEANHKDPVLGPALAARGVTAEQSRGRIMQMLNTPGGLARLINESKLGTEKFMEFNKPQLSTKDIGGTVIDRTFQPLTGEITEVARTAKTMAPGEQERINNEQRRLTQDARRLTLEDRRLAVLEENQRRDADPAFQQQIEAARATGREAAKGDVAAQQALPKLIAGAEQSMKLLDDLIGKRDSKTGKLLKDSKPHPGFQNAVGATWLPGSRFIPGTDAADFMARFDQVKGASFLQAFEALKGGGAITEKEGQKGTDAINRMSTSQSENEFIRAAMDLQDVIRKGVENAQKRASRSASTVPINSSTPAPAVAPAVAGGVKFLGFE